MLLVTDPRSLPSVALIAPFVLLLIVLVSGLYYVFARLGLGSRVRFKAALAGGLVPVMLLVMQSLGQLTPRDALVILALFAVTYLYMSRLGVRSAG